MAAAGLYPVNRVLGNQTDGNEAGSGNKRAVILGATGAGEYGHGLAKIFDGMEDVDVVAVSDADEAGLEKAKESFGIAKGYADFREMLEAEKPDYAVVCPRWTDQHHAMTIAALEAGAHIYLEKPMCTTLAEADEIIALSDEKNLKIAVAHQMRCDPHILRLQKELQEETLIGKLLEIRIYGKMDHRVGGEDMLVLGTHLFDVARLYAGDATTCSATVRKAGQLATKEMAHESAREKIGPLLGDDIRAQFTTESGVDISFFSQAELGSVVGPWGLELFGTDGKLRIFANHPPTMSLARITDPRSPNRTETWSKWPEPEEGEPYHQPIDDLKGSTAANRYVIRDWLKAIEEDREPQGSDHRAMKSLEMIHAVWAAGLSGERVNLPLENREHPLA